MIYKIEPLDRIIDKICRDLGLGYDDIPYADFVEWIADGLQHIGSYVQFTEKECKIIIEDYEGVLPCDLHKVIRLKRGTEVKMGESGFYGGTLTNELINAGIDINEFSPYVRFGVLPVQGIAKVENQGTDEHNRLHHNSNLIANNNSAHTSLDYNVNFDKIRTAFRYGYITIQYLAIPVDERGWPMVPDNVSFRDAMFWKCAYHLSMRDPSKLKNQRMQDMEYCRQQWNRTCVQARGEANMPDLAQLERLKNQWLSLIPNNNMERTDYARLGKPQNVNLNGRH
jgi:hypothetical protein